MTAFASWRFVPAILVCAACALLTPLDDLRSGTGATSFCAGSDARFCEDFDTPDAVPFAQWPLTTMRNGAAFTVDVSDASAPYGVRFTQVGGGASGGVPFGAIERDFTTPAITKSAHAAFDVRIDSFPAFGAVQPMFTLQFDSSLWPAVDDCIGLSVSDTSGLLFECVPTDAGFSTYPSHDIAGRATLGKWMRIDIDLSFSATGIVVTVSFDGVMVLAPTSLDSRIVFGAPAIRLGDVAMDPRASASFIMDNVTFDWK